eukprot:Gb_09492 [translate_table: standard]
MDEPFLNAPMKQMHVLSPIPENDPNSALHAVDADSLSHETDNNGHSGEVILVIDSNHMNKNESEKSLAHCNEGLIEMRIGNDDQINCNKSLWEDQKEPEEGLLDHDFSRDANELTLSTRHPKEPSFDDCKNNFSDAILREREHDVLDGGQSQSNTESSGGGISFKQILRKTSAFNNADGLWCYALEEEEEAEDDDSSQEGRNNTSDSDKFPRSSRSPDPRMMPSNFSTYLARSAYSKPKSRFVESPPPPSISALIDKISSPRPKSPLGGMDDRRVSKSPYRAITTPMMSAEEEEDDPFKDEDVPDNYRSGKCGIWLFVEWTAFVTLMAGLVSSLTVTPLEHHMIWGLELWKWFLMVLVVFCGRLLSGWVIRVLVFMVERNFILRKRVLYFVYGLRKSVKNCLWLAFALLAWNLMFDRKVERSTKNSKVLSFVTRLLVCFLLAAVIWLFKTLLVKVLASSFHVNTYFDRIQESIFHQYVLETLSGPPVMEIQQGLTDERINNMQKKEGEIPMSPDPSKNVILGRVSFRSGVSQRRGCKEEGPTNVINIDKLHKLNQKNVSAWNMKRLISVIRYSGISTIAHTIDKSVNDHDPKDTEITSEWQAKVAAKRIFKNVAKPGAKYIEEDDLLRFMRRNEVTRVFPQFEGAVDTGKITKSSLTNWVVNVYIERKSLAHSLNDTKTAVDQLHTLVSGVVIIVIVVVSLLVLGIATTHVIVLISSQLLLVAFMFGNTCKTIFEAIVFLFIMHPFDVGDRCVVDGVQMIVEEMNILTTVFLRYDNEKIYYPNSVLSTQPISNFYRSPDMGDSIEFCVDVGTPMEKIAALKERISRYIESKPHHWYPKHSVVVKEIENMNKMRMALHLTHTMNHQNMGEKSSRRSDLLLEMKRVFEDLGIEYHLLPQEVHVKFVGSATNQIPLHC